MKRIIVSIIIVISLLLALTGCDLLLPTTTPATSTQYVTLPALTETTTLIITTPAETTSTTKTPTTTTTPAKTTTTTTSLAVTSTPSLTPTVKTIPVSSTPLAGGYIAREFTWNYGLEEWNWKMDIPEDTYNFFKSLPRSPTADYSIYVTHPLNDASIDSLAARLKDNANDEGFTEYDTVCFAISFVQSLPYTSDAAGTGYDEYPRYPIETLVDGGGDCEDTSILAAAILRAMGYGVVLLIFPETADTGGHCAVGLKGGEGITGTYWDYGSDKYYYLETTGDGWEIGEIPEEYQQVSAHIYPMIPVPVFSFSWQSQGVGLQIKLEVNVNNSGSAAAYDVYILAGFDAGNGQVWNKQTSDYFTIGVNESADVTMYLKPPFGEHTRLLVQIVYEGYAVVESYSDWFDL